MHVLAVNVGTATPMANAKSTGATGIYKHPSAGRVFVSALGLKDDAICDVKNHGGVDQAVYLYGAADYAWWAAELGYALEPGTFGENVTISDWESTRYNIGDRFEIGEVLLEVTAPRIPCVTLARRMDDPAFAKRFRAAERPGIYCRVLQEGTIGAGDAVTVEPYQGEHVSALEMFREAFAATQDAATLRRFLAVPLAVRARVEKEEQLRQLLAGSLA